MKSLDVVHHEGIRLPLGAFSISPTESFYVEANELPLKLRREKLAIPYYFKLSSCLSNPAYDCKLNPKYVQIFNQDKNKIKTFGIRKEQLTKELIVLKIIHRPELSNIPYLKPLNNPM